MASKQQKKLLLRELRELNAEYDHALDMLTTLQNANPGDEVFTDFMTDHECKDEEETLHVLKLRVRV